MNRDQQIEKIKKYLIKKHDGRLTLKINNAVDELLMSREQVKRLKHDGLLKSLNCKTVATFIIDNPPVKIQEVAFGK